MHILQSPTRPYPMIQMDHHRVPPLSHAYVPDPMELGEHVPVYIPNPEHPEYHEPSDDDIQASEEDPSEEHEPEDDDEDLEEDPNEEHEPEDEDTKEKEPSEGFDKTEPFEEDETAVTPPPPRHHRARISEPVGHRAAMIRRRDDILEEDMPPRRRFVFIAPPPGCDVAESSAAARAPRGQYDFVDTIEAGQALIRSPGHDARTITRAADRVEDVGYVRALQAFEHRMMTSIEETDRRDIRLEIDVVRGHMIAYEIELQEYRVAVQSVEDLAVTQMMRIHSLKARAQTDMVEDADSSC
uniref:Uncharacterized protein n=1 Tax=Tanacetum cinerariifolium TaxID=118510 RepID=A0A699JHX5_TANCI|nr:hypothetical protein [Tanacetum cinerariifolium]